MNIARTAPVAELESLDSVRVTVEVSAPEGLSPHVLAAILPRLYQQGTPAGSPQPTVTVPEERVGCEVIVAFSVPLGQEGSQAAFHAIRGLDATLEHLARSVLPPKLYSLEGMRSALATLGGVGSNPGSAHGAHTNE